MNNIKRGIIIVILILMPLLTTFKSVWAIESASAAAENEKTPATKSSDYFEISTYGKNSTGANKINYVKRLPQKTVPELIIDVIKILLGISGTLALISFTVAGIMFITAEGAEDKLSKAKKMIFWSLLALAIIATSYAIVLGVTKLRF